MHTDLTSVNNTSSYSMLTGIEMAFSAIEKAISEHCNGPLYRAKAINFDNHFKLTTNFTRSHPLTLQFPSLSINALRYSFYRNTPFLWNSISFEILSADSNSLFCSRLRYHLFFCILLFLFVACVYVLVFFVFVSRDHLVQALPFVCMPLKLIMIYNICIFDFPVVI